MAFTPTGILGDRNASLGEFVLGTFEAPVVLADFTAAGSAAVVLTGMWTAGGKVAASGAGAIAELDASAESSGRPSAGGTSGASFVWGQVGFRLFPRRRGRWEKPPLGAQIEWGAPLANSLRIAALINEGGGKYLHNAVGSARGQASAGVIFALLRGSDPWGAWAQNGYTLKGWFFGSGAGLACPGAVSAAVICRFPSDFEYGPLLFARGTISSGLPGNMPQVASGDWGIYAARVPYSPWTPYLGVWVNTAAGYQYLTFTPPASQPALVGFTYDGITLAAYLNGRIVASSTINSPVVTGSYEVILGGEDGDGNQAWNANIYAAYLWGRALSPAEMEQLWEQPYSAVTIPVRRWIGIPPIAGIQRLGNFLSRAEGTAAWSGYSAFASTELHAAGVAGAAWFGWLETLSTFSAAGKAKAVWDSVPYVSGAFGCGGAGAAEFVGALDAEAYTSLTGGEGAANAAGQNFVF